MAYKFRSGKAKLSGSMTTDDVAYFADTDTLIDWENDYISFKTNNTSVLTVSGSKVGIGTTTPSSLLHLKGTADARIRLQSSTRTYTVGSDGYGFVIHDTTTGGIDGYRFVISDEASSRGYVGIGAGASIAGTNHPDALLHLSSSDDAAIFRADRTDGTPVLFATGSNRVGIGTATPDYTLDVAGNIGLDEYIYHNGDADTSLRFETNAITFQCGGSTLLQVNGTSGNKRVGVGVTDPTSTLTVEGSLATQVKDVTGTSTTLDDAVSLVLMGSDNSNCTVSLPAASTAPGRIYTFKRLAVTNESVLMRITPNGSDEIDGNNSSMSLDTQYNTLTLQSDGSNWWITNEVHMGGG